MKVRTGWVVTALGFLLVGGSLAPSPADDAKDKVADLGRQRLSLIRAAIKIETGRIDAGEGSTEAARMWARRLVNAHRQAGSGKEDYLAALKDLLAYEVRNEARMQTMFKQGGATQLQLLDAQDGLLEARIWLQEGEAK